MSSVREPIKKSSIEKKNRIIEKGFELMCNKGYHNVSCVDIAKSAGVSTGIIYQYFKDKRDIFIAGVKDYSDKIMFPMISVFEAKQLDFNNLDAVLSKMIDKFIRLHTISKQAHEELMAMSYLDQDIAAIFHERELLASERIANILIDNDFKIKNVEEKTHIIYGLIDNYCHEVVYHKHEFLDYDVMKKNIIDIIVFSLTN